MKIQEEIYTKIGNLELKAVCEVDKDFNAELKTLSIFGQAWEINPKGAMLVDNEIQLDESTIDTMISDSIVEDFEEQASIQAQERANAEPEDWKE